MNRKHLFLLCLPLHLLSCVQQETETVVSTINYCESASIPQSEEISECTDHISHSSPVVITGTATFFKRGLDFTDNGSNVTGASLGAPISTALPIKFAEVRVLNSSGSVVQCGKTNASGDLKAADGTSDLQIPNTAGDYTVQVLARSRQNISAGGGKPDFTLHASVKNYCSNDVHKITSTVTSNGTGPHNTNLIAYARESQSAVIAGGAFNIYNNLVVTYDYLAQNTDSTVNLSCLSPKLHVYWTAGFNPAQIIYPDYDPSDLGNISFYLRGYNELYINGGKLGNVSAADTDHFDDAVIIHELAHRIEDVCGKMDSPGGVHYGQFRVDPRLAWSEGWGNFFGAHIIRNNLSSINPDAATDLAGLDNWLYYLDTQGYNDIGSNTGDEIIRINLSRNGNNPENLGGGLYYDKVDSASHPGEGHFREVSIARSLFKSTNTCNSPSCTGLNYMSYIWKAFENIGVGMGKSTYPFRSSARFYERLTAVSAGATLPASIANIINTDEAQQIDSSYYSVSGTTKWVPYGIKLVSNGNTPCNLQIEPRSEEYAVTFLNSDQRYSNHFYYFERAGLTNVTDIYLNVLNKVSGSNTDIDLILYQDGYTFPTETCTNDDCTAHVKNVSSPQFVRADRTVVSNTSVPYTKRISNLNNLNSAVPYLLNIRAYTADLTILSNTAYNYELRDQSGAYLCPAATF